MLTGLEEGSNVGLDVGVEFREGLDFADKEGREVGVVALLRLGFPSFDDEIEGLLLSTLAGFSSGDGLSVTQEDVITSTCKKHRIIQKYEPKSQAS